MFHHRPIRVIGALALAALAISPLAACSTSTAGTAVPASAAIQSPPADGILDGGTPAPVVRLKSSGEAGGIVLPAQRNEIGAMVSPTATMENFLYAALLDVHGTWSRYFTEWGYAQPVVNYEFPQTAAQATTGCERAEPMLQYCPSEDRISISRQTARDIWEGRYGQLTNAGTGSMSVATFVAHEYGHNIARELKLKLTAAQGERMADCFAGAWAADATRRGIVEDGGIDQALAGLDLLAEHPEFGLHDNGVHGTPAMRHEAFAIGWYQKAHGCVSTYSS